MAFFDYYDRIILLKTFTHHHATGSCTITEGSLGRVIAEPEKTKPLILVSYDGIPWIYKMKPEHIRHENLLRHLGSEA